MRQSDSPTEVLIPGLLGHRILTCFVAMAIFVACDRPRDVSPKRSWFTCQAPPPRKADSFGSSMQTAMAHMDAAMNVASSGDPDRDFAAMMIPHHQGAVDMALAELRFGNDPRLQRLAAGIIVEQRSEIAWMQQLLDEMGSPLARTPAPQDQLVSDRGARK
jgi:uncharacterized protein (DUF305 family)